MSEIKLGFATSVKLGLSCMKSIYDTGNKLSLVITLPNNIAIKKAGRVFLDDFCEQHQISLIKSSNINNYDVINEIKKKKNRLVIYYRMVPNCKYRNFISS